MLVGVAVAPFAARAALKEPEFIFGDSNFIDWTKPFTISLREMKPWEGLIYFGTCENGVWTDQKVSMFYSGNLTPHR